MYIDLLQIQRSSFLKFLQNGIYQVFDNINPIIIANRKYIFFSKYYLLKIPSPMHFEKEFGQQIDTFPNLVDTSTLKRNLETSAPIKKDRFWKWFNRVEKNGLNRLITPKFNRRRSEYNIIAYYDFSTKSLKKKFNMASYYDILQRHNKSDAKKRSYLLYKEFKSNSFSNSMQALNRKFLQNSLTLIPLRWIVEMDYKNHPTKKSFFDLQNVEINKNASSFVKKTKFSQDLEYLEQNYANNNASTKDREKTSQLTYSSEFYIPVQIIDQISKKMYLRWLLLADLPIQTKRGHFIINGYPKTVIHQIVRSPGIRFKNQTNNLGSNQILADIISMRGAWMSIQIIYEKSVKAENFYEKRTAADVPLIVRLPKSQTKTMTSISKKILSKTHLTEDTNLFVTSFPDKPYLYRYYQINDLFNKSNNPNPLEKLESSLGRRRVLKPSLPSNIQKKMDNPSFFANISKINNIEAPTPIFLFNQNGQWIDHLNLLPKYSNIEGTIIQSKLAAANSSYSEKSNAWKRYSSLTTSKKWSLKKPSKKVRNYKYATKSIFNNQSLKRNDWPQLPLNPIKESDKMNNALSINFFISPSKNDKGENKKIKLYGLTFLDYLFDNPYFTYNNYVPSSLNSSFFPAYSSLMKKFLPSRQIKNIYEIFGFQLFPLKNVQKGSLGNQNQKKLKQIRPASSYLLNTCNYLPSFNFSSITDTRISLLDRHKKDHCATLQKIIKFGGSKNSSYVKNRFGFLTDKKITKKETFFNKLSESKIKETSIFSFKNSNTSFLNIRGFGENGNFKPGKNGKFLRQTPVDNHDQNNKRKFFKTISSNRLLASHISILNTSNFRDILFERFMNAKFYDIGYMGRKRLNKKLRLNIPLQCTTLTPLDFLALFYKLFSLYNHFSTLQNYFSVTSPSLGDPLTSLANFSFSLETSNTNRALGSVALRETRKKLLNIDPLNAPGTSKPSNDLISGTKQTGSLDHLNQRHIRTSGEFLFLQFWRAILRFYQVLSLLSTRSNFIKSSYTYPGKTGRNFFSLSSLALNGWEKPKATLFNELQVSSLNKKLGCRPSQTVRFRTEYTIPIVDNLNSILKSWGYPIFTSPKLLNWNYRFQLWSNGQTFTNKYNLPLQKNWAIRSLKIMPTNYARLTENQLNIAALPGSESWSRIASSMGTGSTIGIGNQVSGWYPNATNSRTDSINIRINRNDLASIFFYSSQSPYRKGSGEKGSFKKRIFPYFLPISNNRKQLNQNYTSAIYLKYPLYFTRTITNNIWNRLRKGSLKINETPKKFVFPKIAAKIMANFYKLHTYLPVTMLPSSEFENQKTDLSIKKLLYESKELRVFDAKERMRNLETKLFNGVFKEFFNLDPLSQDLDETNGLSAIIHKRRISALGKGGVTSKNAPLSIRSIHPSFYGRLCPIDSPEGDRVGLINSLTAYARITSIGYIATPFYRTRVYSNKDSYTLQIQQSPFNKFQITKSLPMRICPPLAFFGKIYQSHGKYQNTSRYISGKINLKSNNEKQLALNERLSKESTKNNSRREFYETKNSIVKKDHRKRKVEVLSFYDTHYMTPPITLRENLINHGYKPWHKNVKPTSYLDNEKNLPWQKIDMVNNHNHSSRSFNSNTRPCLENDNSLNNRSADSYASAWSFLTGYFDFIYFQGYAPVSNLQFFSPGVGLIPFLEHDDGTRALMGANMQRQAVPLIMSSRPIVGTGLEKNVAASFIISSTHSGYLYYISGKQSKQILIRWQTFTKNAKTNLFKTVGFSKSFKKSKQWKSLQKGRKWPGGRYMNNKTNVIFESQPLILNTNWLPYRKSYKATCIEKKPAVLENSWLQKGDLLVNGTSSINGELSLGRNLFSIYMPWEGYNFEDAILISDKAAQDYTSIHIEEFSVKISKNEQVTSMIKPYTWVNHGTALVSKKRKHENSFIMNRLLFGMSSKGSQISNKQSDSNHHGLFPNQNINQNKKEQPFILGNLTYDSNDYLNTETIKFDSIDRKNMPNFIESFAANTGIPSYGGNYAANKSLIATYKGHYAAHTNNNWTNLKGLQMFHLPYYRFLKNHEILINDSSNLKIIHQLWSDHGTPNFALEKPKISNVNRIRRLLDNDDNFYENFNKRSRKILNNSNSTFSKFKAPDTSVSKYIDKSNFPLSVIKKFRENYNFSQNKVDNQLFQGMNMRSDRLDENHDHFEIDTSYRTGESISGWVLSVKPNLNYSLFSEPQQTRISSKKNNTRLSNFQLKTSAWFSRIFPFLETNNKLLLLKKPRSVKLTLFKNLKSVPLFYRWPIEVNNNKSKLPNFSALKHYQHVHFYMRQRIAKKNQNSVMSLLHENENENNRNRVNQPKTSTTQNSLLTRQPLSAKNKFHVKLKPWSLQAGPSKKNNNQATSNNEKTNKSNDTIYIYIAVAKPLQVGDKMSGRHGNKGIISKILPFYDMPYLVDGTPIDIILNPLGVPSRMNVGQIYESLLGLTGYYKQEYYRIPAFDENYSNQFSRNFVYWKLNELNQLHQFGPSVQETLSSSWNTPLPSLPINSINTFKSKWNKMVSFSHLITPSRIFRRETLSLFPVQYIKQFNYSVLWFRYAKTNQFLVIHKPNHYIINPMLINFQPKPKTNFFNLKPIFRKFPFARYYGKQKERFYENLWLKKFDFSRKNQNLCDYSHKNITTSLLINWNNSFYNEKSPLSAVIRHNKLIKTSRRISKTSNWPRAEKSLQYFSDLAIKNFNGPSTYALSMGLNPYFPGKMRLLNGMTGETFYRPIIVGKSYMLKLIHLVHHKIHARATGPYALINQQPLKGKRNQGGQRMGEMEIWALYGFGSASILYEMLTIKSDDPVGRERILREIAGLKSPPGNNDSVHHSYSSFWKNETQGTFSTNNDPLESGIAESFRVLVMNLRALCLDMQVFKDLSNRQQVKFLQS